MILKFLDKILALIGQIKVRASVAIPFAKRSRRVGNRLQAKVNRF